MPGRNEKEAWRNFRDPILRVVGCVDLTVRNLVERQFADGNRFLAAPARGIPFGPSLSLHFALTLQPKREGFRDWRMTTLKYDYTLVRPQQPDRIVFGWHWHPKSKRSPVTYPHLHVPSAEQFPSKHIPTGRISLEDVIVFGFRELSVPVAHPQAQSVVDEVMAKHKAHRSWS